MFDKIWLIYHNADSDGTCCGFLMRWAIENDIIPFPRKEEKIKMFPFNYNFEIPWEHISPNDVVFWMDVAGTTQEMARMYEKIDGKMFWIDHHKSIEDEHPEIHEKCLGIRNFNQSACLNVYEFIESHGVFEDESLKKQFVNIKPLIEIVGACDTWDLEKVDYDMDKWDSEYFSVKLALDANITNPKNEQGWNFWIDFMSENEDEVLELIEELQYDGGVILAYLNIRNKNLCSSYGAEVDFEGLKVFVLNQGIGGSYVFNSIDLNKYDACMCFVKSCKNNAFTISLYTDKEDVDLIESLEHLGFRGHAHAGGFKCKDVIITYTDDGRKKLKIKN